MATPLLIPALATGEVSPSLFGRVDVDRERIACGTARNAWVNYRGGLNSRAGTKFVAFSKQTGRDLPPRVIPFQFSIKQGRALEFGNFYMRVVADGEMVTETPVGVGNATQTDPCVIGYGAFGAGTATPINTFVTFPYAPGDLITLSGGVGSQPAVLEVTTVQLDSILVDEPGSGYAINDTITLAGGTFSVAAVVKVVATIAVKATGSFALSVNPADTNTIALNGTTWTFVATLTGAAQTVIQSSLIATILQLVADLNASADAGIDVATYVANGDEVDITFDTAGVAGNAYTIDVSGTPGATRSGANLTKGSASGAGALQVVTPGTFSAVPGGWNMTQSASSGGGTAATFQTAVFGPKTASIADPGAYTSVPANPVAQASTDGLGQGAIFTMAWVAAAAFHNGDWVFISGVDGMTELNGNTYVVAGATVNTFQLRDVYGNPIDATGFGAYIGGGTLARVFTLTTPYADADLPYLKFTQSADVMTLCCVNQETGAEYQPQDLSRSSDTSWAFSSVVAVPSVNPPGGVTTSISDPNGNTFYAYQVTAVSPDDGTESIASTTSRAKGVSIATSPNTQANISWSAVVDVSLYKIYKAQISDLSEVPTGSLFGYIGSSYGPQFLDKNYTADFSTVPPRHKDPFARGQLLQVIIVTVGVGYVQDTTTATAVSGTGSGAVLTPVVVGGSVVAIIIEDQGKNYLPGDTISIAGAGSGATAAAGIGPLTGTYPSVPGYFQQRRVFANSTINPDAYNMSQPGAFTNFDTRLPTIDTDAITGSPWSVQVDGIQALLQTAAGLLVMTGQSAWMLVGQGSFANNVQAISPSSQVANPLPFTGCSATVPPQKILFDVLYVTAKGDFVYQLPYQGYAFTEPIDLTEYATHLFVGFTVKEWAWCEQPFKLDWVVRDDGTMLSLSYLKAEQVIGWARHDTNGYFRSVCHVTEPPVDALYCAVQRFPGGHDAYMIERMDDRIWTSVDDAWCVDSALTIGLATPNGDLTADSAYGLGAISGVTDLVGGSGWSGLTTATITDQAKDASGNPIGSGATASVTIAGGVITAVNITAPGADYRNPKIEFFDADASSGGNGSASATLQLDTSAQFTSNEGIFSPGDIGSVIRMGGGIATVTAYLSNQEVTATITTPIADIRPNSGGVVAVQANGAWTLGVPVSSVSGLLHLAGATVTGLGDGRVIPPTVVNDDGSVDLPFSASAITLGLGFQVQVQSVPIDAGSPTVQGQRKDVIAVSAYVQDSRSVKLGNNQTDGSTLSPPQIAPQWDLMTSIPDSEWIDTPYNSITTPLGTGWVRTPVQGGWGKLGQIAVQQDDPVPLNIVSLVPELSLGDQPDQNASKRQQQAKAA